MSEDPFMKSFMKFLDEEMQKETLKIMDKYKSLMEQDLDEARRDILGKSAVNISKYVDFHSDRNNLVITIKDTRRE